MTHPAMPIVEMVVDASNRIMMETRDLTDKRQLCADVVLAFTLMVALILAATSASAQESTADVSSEEESVEASNEPATEEVAVEEQPDTAELQRRLEVLAAEVERMRSAEEAQPVDPEQARRLGLAPSAAAAYGLDRGVSVAGYGEMLIENYSDRDQGGNATGKTTKSDFLRAVIYTGYRFNDKFLFNSEIEVEHGKEIYVEFAYLDYQATENFGVRGGMLLAPMGLVNEFHEPTVFMGAERPVTENKIIPSTWRENGAGIYATSDWVSFRAYVMNGFNGSKFSSGGVRGGRQKGAKAQSTSMAFTGRLDITPTPGVFFGASVYSGDSGQGAVVVDDTEYGIPTTIWDLHGQVQVRGFDLRGLFARAQIGDSAQLNAKLGKSGTSGIAEHMQGSYIQVGYDFLSQLTSAGGVSLTPYLRYEVVDTQAQMPDGFARSLSTDNTYVTAGIELKPIPNIAVKVDHAWVSNDADTGINQFNVNMGYAF